MSNFKEDVAVIFPSGRRFVNDVVSMLESSLSANNHFDNYNIHLIVSYDPSFYNLSPQDFIVDSSTTSKFASTTYSGPEDVSLFTRFKEFPNVDETSLDILFNPNRGYSSQKNRAIVTALEKDVNYILFLDDDEYFTAPFRNSHDSSLEWIAQDIFGVHMVHIPNNDITNGAHVGYFSPIPSDLELNLEENIRRTLGKILSIGNEVINEMSFLHTLKDVKYADPDFLQNAPYPIEEFNGIRSLNGGNIALNVSSIIQGKIPPYFNPPGARGEDAILGMQISDLDISKVPVYTFHDPFQKYVSITNGIHPDEIEAIKVIPGTIERFAKACIGWVKYAPFLIRLTSDSEETYRSRIESMKWSLHQLGSEIDAQLNWSGFDQMAPVLEQYDLKSQQHIRELGLAKVAWNSIVENICCLHSVE